MRKDKLYHPWTYKYFAVFFVFFFVILLFYVFILKKVVDEREFYESQNKVLYEEIKKAKEQIELEPLVKSSFEDIKNRMRIIKNMFVSPQEDVSILLKEINNASLLYEIQVVKVKPITVSPQEKKSKFFTHNKFEITVKADYHNFGKFLSNLLNRKILMDVSNIKISRTGEDNLLEISFVLKVYKRLR